VVCFHNRGCCCIGGRVADTGACCTRHRHRFGKSHSHRCRYSPSSRFSPPRFGMFHIRRLTQARSGPRTPTRTSPYSQVLHPQDRTGPYSCYPFSPKYWYPHRIRNQEELGSLRTPWQHHHSNLRHPHKHPSSRSGGLRSSPGSCQQLLSSVLWRHCHKCGSSLECKMLLSCHRQNTIDRWRRPSHRPHGLQTSYPQCEDGIGPREMLLLPARALAPASLQVVYLHRHRTESQGNQ